MRLTLEVAFALAAAIFLGAITFSAMNRSAHIPAFVIIEADQQQSNSSLPHRAVEADSIVQQGGIILTRAATPAESLEGPPAGHMVIAQWPDLEVARRWYRSSAKKVADENRATGGRRVVLVQGATDWP